MQPSRAATGLFRPMFDAYVAFQARLRPTNFAIITPQRWATYGELDADVDRFAAGLRDLGVAPQRGVVSIRTGNNYLTHVLLLALARLGVVSSPRDDPAFDLQLVVGERKAGPKQLVLTADWIAATFRAEPRPVTPVRCEPETVVRVMLSSGTTRTARRVPRTWRALEGNTRMAALTYLAGKPGRWVCLTGMDTGLGQSMTLAAWHQGATIVANYSPQDLAGKLEALRPSIVGVTPIFLRQLLASLPEGLGVQPGLRIVSTGGVLPPAVALEARLRLSSEILISYGAAETGNATMADGAWLERTPGVAGYPSPGVRVEVVDESGAVAPLGEQGEVRIFSDRDAGGYIGDPEATARAFRDGAFYPGDVGRMLPGGLLVVEGRVDDRMDLGGVKFLPDLLEEVAIACPGVLDAAAYAAPDAQGMDVCWLAVSAADDFDRQSLADHIARSGRRLPPVRFAWIKEIPRNAMGKVERRKLREETMAVLGVAETR